MTAHTEPTGRMRGRWEQMTPEQREGFRRLGWRGERVDYHLAVATLLERAAGSSPSARDVSAETFLAR